MNIFKFFISLAFLVILTSSPAGARPKQQLCIFVGDNGVVKQANSLDEVPEPLRKGAKCFEATNKQQRLAPPEEIELKGNIRNEELSTSLGQIHLRWPRTVEQLFGRNPLRATTDAANTVSKALSTSAFPSTMQKLNLDWQIVFMDDRLPETQIPSHLVMNCHPGWMTPPANIYIVGQRVAGNCSGSTRMQSAVADSTLAEVLVHEMGHAVEFQLLQQKMDRDLIRSEGFATWFEIFAADYSSVISKSSLQKETFAKGRYAIKQSPDTFLFMGSDLDYARSSLYFSAVVDRSGVRGLVQVYERINEKGLTFLDSIKETMHWDNKQLEKEVDRISKRY